MTESLINAMDEGLKGRRVVKVLKMSKCKITDDLFAKLL
jgi:RNA-binding protein YhbY